jgi:hypothetical protein
MRKFRLGLDSLQVESFAPSHETQQRGTVRAHSEWDTRVAPCQSYAGPGWSCDGSCEPTCGPRATCGAYMCGTYPEHGCSGEESYPILC